MFSYHTFHDRNIDLGSISCYGFDMDYTLCEYITPQLELLTYQLAQQYLVNQLGHPPQLTQLSYDHQLPVRGAWFDRKYGNVLVVDQLGVILECRHANRYKSELSFVSFV